MEDPQFKIKCLLRARLKSVISRKKKVGSFVRDLGCTVEEVQGYIESHENWSPEWTWKNWGTLWELDHIRAIVFFDLEDREQFLQAAHFSSLQPLSINRHKEKTKEDVRLVRWFKKECVLQ
jgi:hypothetical protein